jgi:sugar phosphate isomerase/epimerase
VSLGRRGRSGMRGYVSRACAAGACSSFRLRLRVIVVPSMKRTPWGRIVLLWWWVACLSSRDLVGARACVQDGLTALLPYATAAGVKLALEPLHPMTCADRSVLNTTGQALDLAERLGPEVGVALDVYHIWWDPDVAQNISRARDRIHGFHACDWLVPTRDLVFDRGMMGDGVVEIPALRSLVEDACYAGMIEVKILSNEWWKRDPDDVLRIVKERFESCV